MRRFTAPILALALALASCAAPEPVHFHQSAPGRSQPQHLRVMAYNVKHGQGMDRRIDLSRVAGIIRAHQPDVVTLQEIDVECRRSGGVDQAAALGELCGMQHVFGAFMDYDGGQYGMALLSRLPIIEVRNHQLPPGAEPRSALAARIRLGEDGPDVVVVGIHFYRTPAERLAQARALAAVYRQEQAPVILAGDFNSERQGPVLQFLEQQWLNPDKSGAAGTFPSRWPSREIDFVLLRPKHAFTVKRHLVIAEAVASDHRPLIIDLELNLPKARARQTTVDRAPTRGAAIVSTTTMHLVSSGRDDRRSSDQRRPRPGGFALTKAASHLVDSTIASTAAKASR